MLGEEIMVPYFNGGLSANYETVVGFAGFVSEKGEKGLGVPRSRLASVRVTQNKLLCG